MGVRRGEGFRRGHHLSPIFTLRQFIFIKKGIVVYMTHAVRVSVQNGAGNR